jgi:hypothetical protein
LMIPSAEMVRLRALHLRRSMQTDPRAATPLRLEDSKASQPRLKSPHQPMLQHRPLNRHNSHLGQIVEARLPRCLRLLSMRKASSREQTAARSPSSRLPSAAASRHHHRAHPVGRLHRASRSQMAISSCLGSPRRLRQASGISTVTRSARCRVSIPGRRASCRRLCAALACLCQSTVGTAASPWRTRWRGYCAVKSESREMMAASHLRFCGECRTLSSMAGASAIEGSTQPATLSLLRMGQYTSARQELWAHH